MANNRKIKYNIDEQIEHMKKQNIQFKLYTEEEAKAFLQFNNYYFKVKAFSKNYKKENGQYINLDFRYLRKFTILDTLFRDLVLELSLLCEHLIKTNLCYECSSNPKDDGYQVVQDFISASKLPKSIEYYDQNNVSIYSKDLLDKYRNELPVWVLVEILNFDELIKFYNFYIKRFQLSKKVSIFNLYAIKSIRNVAAHNSCILHTLTMHPLAPNLFKTSTPLKQKLREKKLLTIRQDNILRIPMIHDFLCLILTFNEICPKTDIKQILKNKINDFFNKCEERNEYFCQDKIIKDRYKFIKKSSIAILS